MKLDFYLRELISFKTLSHDHQTNVLAFAWVKKQLEGLPLFFEDFESNGFPSLLITTRKTKTPHIWLQGHMDVVPGPEEVFTPRLVGSKLYGRGTFDMKFAIACYIQLLTDLGDKLREYDLGVMLTSDEEIGGANGVGILVQKGYHARSCLLPDGGENWVFQEGAKGIYQASITAVGKAAHGARPWKGSNAIETLLTFLERVRKSFPTEPCGDKDHYHDTLTIGTIQGGTVTNQVPVEASASLDIRYTPDTTESEILAILKKARQDDPNIIIAEQAKGLSYRVDKQNQYFQLFASLVTKHTDKKTAFLFSPGSSDARFFINNNVPTILIRPTGANLHQDDEWIDVKDLEKFYIILREYIEEFK